MEHQPITGHSTLDHVLTIVGALVPLFSAIASFLNHRVRITQNDGKDASPSMLAAAATLNMLSVNIDKGIQLAKMARGEEVPTTQPKDQANG